MNKNISLLSTIFTLATLPAFCADHWLKVGENVEIDIQMAKRDKEAKWRIGKICEINKKANCYIIEMPDKSKKKIINNPKWIKAASPAVLQSLTEPAEIKPLDAEKKGKESGSGETMKTVAPTDSLETTDSKSK